MSKKQHKVKPIPRQIRWDKLDNTAHLFPSIAGESMTNVYRISVELNEEVQREALQQALDIVLPKFDGFNVRLRTGVFWYYFEENGKTYIHIIDPRTGFPVEGDLLSVTIVSEDGTLADGMSTALYIMGYEKACQFWQQHQNEFAVILITQDGRIHVSDRLQECFQSENDWEIIESGN